MIKQTKIKIIQNCVILSLLLLSSIAMAGVIDNLGSMGMFIKTVDGLKINTKLDILIDFNPNKNHEITMKAEGVVLRSEREGFAIRFTKISTMELGQCIIKKLNT